MYLNKIFDKFFFSLGKPTKVKRTWTLKTNCAHYDNIRKHYFLNHCLKLMNSKCTYFIYIYIQLRYITNSN